MLVVVAVIAILAALLFPALAAARRQADAARCAQNLHQIGLGLRLYADSDPSGSTPGNPFSGPPPIGLSPWPTWIYSLSNQISSVDGLRLCPSDAFRRMLATNFGCSYVLNEYTSTDHDTAANSSAITTPSSVTGPGGDKHPTFPSTRRLDALPNLSGTILVFEASRLSQQIGDLETHPDAWFFGWDRVLADIDPYRHGRCANYLFGDAHVEMIPARVLQRRIESGDNFAVPPN